MLWTPMVMLHISPHSHNKLQRSWLATPIHLSGPDCQCKSTGQPCKRLYQQSVIVVHVLSVLQ